MTSTADTPLVSVVIPAWNAAWCVGRAIDSVLAQSLRDFELIVVDDGSTDETAAVLTAYGPALRPIRKPNGGLSSTRNAGIRAARGEFVAFLDADDWWLPDKLERQIALMRGSPDLVFCSTAARIEGSDGQKLGEWRCGTDARAALEAIFAVNAFVAGSGSAVLVRRDALERVGGFDETLDSLEDIDMWMRLAAIGGYACVPLPLVVILKRNESMSGNFEIMRSAAIKVMRKNRNLLQPARRGAFWRHAYAGMLSDYVKWASRAQRRGRALADTLTGLCMAPLSRGRLLLGLLAAIILGRSI